MNKLLYKNLNIGKDNALSTCVFRATEVMCIFVQSFENIRKKKADKAQETLKCRPEKTEL